MLGGELLKQETISVALSPSSRRSGGLKKDNPYQGRCRKGRDPGLQTPGDREVCLQESPAPPDPPTRQHTWLWAKSCLSRTKTLQGVRNTWGKSCWSRPGKSELAIPVEAIRYSALHLFPILGGVQL